MRAALQAPHHFASLQQPDGVEPIRDATPVHFTPVGSARKEMISKYRKDGTVPVLHRSIKPPIDGPLIGCGLQSCRWRGVTWAVVGHFGNRCNLLARSRGSACATVRTLHLTYACCDHSSGFA